MRRYSGNPRLPNSLLPEGGPMAMARGPHGTHLTAELRCIPEAPAPVLAPPASGGYVSIEDGESSYEPSRGRRRVRSGGRQAALSCGGRFCAASDLLDRRARHRVAARARRGVADPLRAVRLAGGPCAGLGALAAAFPGALLLRRLPGAPRGLRARALAFARRRGGLSRSGGRPARGCRAVLRRARLARLSDPRRRRGGRRPRAVLAFRRAAGSGAADDRGAGRLAARPYRRET